MDQTTPKTAEVDKTAENPGKSGQNAPKAPFPVGDYQAFQTNYRQAVSALLTGDRVYAEVLLRMKLVLDDSQVPTLAVSLKGEPRLYISTAFFNAANVRDRVGFLKHEAAHILAGHPARRAAYRGLNPTFLNICEDIAINQMIPEFPDSMEYQGQRQFFATYNNYKKQYPTLEANRPTQYYIEFFKEQSAKNGGKGDGEGGGVPIYGFDSHDWEGSLEEEATGKDLASQAKKAAEASNWGLPDGIRQLIESQFRAAIDWRKEMRHFAESSEVIDRESDRRRRNRRYGILYPGSKKEYSREVMIGFDVSGSMSDELIAQVNETVGHIYAAGARVTVVYFDHAIEKVVEDWTPINKKDQIPGGGGTNFQPVLDLARQRKVDALIMLTDGYCADQLERPRFPVLWGLVEGGQAPAGWGRTLQVVADGVGA